jgi:hypothetical protein
MSDEKIETFDEKRKVGILSGKPPSEEPIGPRRRAPMYYAGQTYGRRRIGRTGGKTQGREILYPDVERYANGAVPGKRDKLARRVIRGALKRSFSSVERALKLPRAMKEQARLIAKEQGKSSQWALRLFDRELAIHETVYAPSKKELRAMRTAKRKGKKDAISQLVDKMTGQAR